MSWTLAVFLANTKSRFGVSNYGKKGQICKNRIRLTKHIYNVKKAYLTT